MEKRKHMLEYKNRKEESDDDENMYCCVLEPKKDEEAEIPTAEEVPSHIKHVPDKYTFTQNSTFYLFWQPIMVCANLITNIIYPTYTILSFEEVEFHHEKGKFSDN